MIWTPLQIVHESLAANPDATVRLEVRPAGKKRDEITAGKDDAFGYAELAEWEATEEERLKERARRLAEAQLAADKKARKTDFLLLDERRRKDSRGPILKEMRSMLIFMVIFLWVIYARRNIGEAKELNDAVKSAFVEEEFAIGKAFDDIRTYDELNGWIEEAR